MNRRIYLLIAILGVCALILFYPSHAPKNPSSQNSSLPSETASTNETFSPSSSSTHESQENINPEQNTEVRTPPIAPPQQQVTKPQPKKIVLYIEKNPIPKAWLEEWNKDITVEQRLLVTGQPAPTDGDLYSISPRVLNELRGKVEFAKFEANTGLEGIDPAFTGQAFDIDNEWTRPWRWTPYFFFLRLSDPTAKTPTPDNLLKNWSKHTSSIWTSDTDLLVALKIKEAGRSINLPKNANWTQTQEQLLKDITSRTASEEECWQAIRDGKVEVTYLPAATRLRPPMEDPANLRWFAPQYGTQQHGTLVQFDLLAINKNSAASETSLSLVKFLTHFERQQKMVTDTGYFPVKIKPSSNKTNATLPPPGTTGCPIPLPSVAWFSSSEFLLAPSVESITKAIPVEAH